jgi:hypothetical protein
VEAGDLSLALLGRAGAAEAGIVATVLLDETVVGEGLSVSWATPVTIAPPANTIPKTQPDIFRAFIKPHTLFMVLSCCAVVQ